MAFLDELRGAGAGFDDPRMPQELVEALLIQSLLFAITGELILQRGELGEGRVRIGGAIAGGGRSRVVTQRWTALAVALVASLVTTAVAITPVAFVAAVAIAIAELFALGVAVASLALETLAAFAPVALLLAALFGRNRGCAFGRWRGRAFGRDRCGSPLGRRALTLAEIPAAVTAVAMAPLAFALLALALARRGGSRLAFLARTL
jgi:hypothetical protein